MTKSTGVMTARQNLKPMVLHYLVTTLMTHSEIAELTGVDQSTVTRWGDSMLGAACMRQRANRQWQSKRAHTLACMNGYPLVRTPSWFKGYNSNGKSFEHQVVYYEAAGLIEVPKGYHVHHKNGIRNDNRIDNLELLTASEHAIFHRSEK